MTKRSSLLSLVLALCLFFAFAANAFAAEGDNVFLQEKDSQDNTFVVPISSNESGEEYSVVIGYIGNDSNSRAFDLTYVEAAIYRIGATDLCEIYLNWGGTDVYNAWQCRECIVSNGNIINSIIYGSIKNWFMNVTASRVGSVVIGLVTIPADVSEARIDFSSLMGYDINTASWRSVAMVGKMGTVH